MKLLPEEQSKREEIITRSDKAVNDLNDHSQKHEKLLKLFKSWKKEDQEGAQRLAFEQFMKAYKNKSKSVRS